MHALTKMLSYYLISLSLSCDRISPNLRQCPEIAPYKSIDTMLHSSRVTLLCWSRHEKKVLAQPLEQKLDRTPILNVCVTRQKYFLAECKFWEIRSVVQTHPI